MSGMGFPPQNKKEVKDDSNISACVKGGCHLLKYKTMGRRRSERALRMFVLNMSSWGCPSDIQEAVPVGGCVYGLDCKERSGIGIYIGVTLSAWW